MQAIKDKQIKLEQKKAKMAMEETRLKIIERKMRTRLLIETGGLVTKSGLEHLPTNVLYGALLSIKEELDNNENIISNWQQKGNAAFNEENQKTTPVILKFEEEPSSDVREFIRSKGLRFNRFRYEWYGNVTMLDELKNNLSDIKYKLEILAPEFS